MLRTRISLFLFLLSCSAFCQQQNSQQPRDRKGNIYFYWGWNWAGFSHSDIHFTGRDYDFTLYDVVATDRPRPFTVETYLNPLRATNPQYNFRLGYFLSTAYNISFGIDHMKYVVQRDQIVKISGYIDKSETIYDGTYDHDDIAITDDFLALEHTNGLNYLNFDFRRLDNIAIWKKIEFNLTEGIGAGALMPRTDATLLNYERSDEFHLAGFGINAMAALNIAFGKIFFIQTELKGGYINMPSVRTTIYTSDKATQDFFFSQINLVFGANIHPKKSADQEKHK